MKKTTLVLAASLVMIGCGGGGGDDTNSGNNSSSFKNGNGSASQASRAGFEEKGKVLYSKTINYTISTTDIPDYLTMTGSGTKRYVFGNWGKKTLEEENEHTTTVINMPEQPSRTVEDDKHEMSKTVDFISYRVNYKRGKIRKTDYTELVGAFTQMSKSDEFLKKFKDSNISVEDGTDTVLGYTCKVYKTPALGASTCFYKNIPLKMDIDLLSTTEDGSSHMIISEIATSIDFDSNVDESEFNLPDFPIED